MNIRIHKITPRSYVDGPGCRAVVFLQGCSLRCPGCQNQHLWPADGGRLVDVHDLAETLALLAGETRAVTISGGEPFQQPVALSHLVEHLRNFGVTDIVVYTGYTWDVLFSLYNLFAGCLTRILPNINVLVDGRFIAAQDDPLISWRGSRNQRPIDVPASLECGHPVLLDWDSPEVSISPDGLVYMPAGLVETLAEVGDPAPTRMCGQTR